MAAEELISTHDEEITVMRASGMHKGKIQNKHIEKDNKKKYEGQCYYYEKTGPSLNAASSKMKK